MSKAAGPSWQSLDHDLAKSERAKIRAHWDEFVQYTVPPGISFEWSVWGIEAHLRHWCLHNGFIERDGDGKWQTTERLWMWLIDNAGDNEVIGSEARGQEKLPVDTPSESCEPRILGDETGSTRSPMEKQITLSGDDASQVVNDESKKLLSNLAKSGAKPNRAGKAQTDSLQQTLAGACKPRERVIDVAPVLDDGQATIAVFRGEWVAGSTVTTLARPAGTTYG